MSRHGSRQSGSGRRSLSAGTGRVTGAAALERLIDETRALFHHLKRAAEVVHHEDGLAAGARGILVELSRGGPRTVPDMARARPVSRQHIQMLVNPLIDRGLVTLVDNPRHRRSKLVTLTPRGRQVTARVQRREATVLTRLADGLRHDDLVAASDTLRRVREQIAIDLGGDHED